MPDEVSKVTEIKTTSDGTVNISVEKYNELVEAAARKPAVINQTTVIKTAEMVAEEKRLWGGGLMVLGASLFAIGLGLFRSGMSG